MALRKFLWFSVLVLAACSSRQDRKSAAQTSQQHNSKFTYRMVIDTSLSEIDHYPSLRDELNKKNFTKNGNYYMLVPFSDSAVKIAWGNDTLKKVYDKPLDFFSAYKLCGVKWENKNYLILVQSQGSDAWTNFVLPLNNIDQPKVIYNGLCFDTINNLIVSEGLPWNDPLLHDTVLVAKNLKTGQSQFITEKDRSCDAGFRHSCIDSISIHNKLLYYKWSIPNNIDENKKSVERRIKITI